MKVILLLICICSQLNTLVQAFTTQELDVMVVKCRDEFGATAAHIDNVVRLYVYATSREEKCFRACLMKQIGTLNENGKYVKEVGYLYSKNLANGDANMEKLFYESIDECADMSVPDDHCEAAETYNVCFIDASAARGVSFALGHQFE